MKLEEKNKALERRRKGWSIKRIAKQLEVSVSSVSLWVKSIILTDEQKNLLKLNQNIASTAAVVNNARERRVAYRKQGYLRAKSDPEFRVICALYWGEGTKGKGKFCITNSDPKLIGLFWKWLVKEQISKKAFFSVCYHLEEELPEQKIEDWWRRQLPGLSADNIKKFSVKNTSKVKVKKIGKIPFGTASLGICSVELQQQVLGGIDFLATMQV